MKFINLLVFLSSIHFFPQAQKADSSIYSKENESGKYFKKTDYKDEPYLLTRSSIRRKDIPDTLMITPVFRFRAKNDHKRQYHFSDTIITPTIRYYPPSKEVSNDKFSR